MNKAHNAAKPQHLPQFVGYALVASHLDVSRRTVERMVREGKFPMPVQLTPNREGWKADIVEEWMDERTKRLVAHAVTHPGSTRAGRDGADDADAGSVAARAGIR